MSSSTDACCRWRRRTTSTTTSTWASSRGWPSWGSSALRSRPSTAARGLDFVCEALICEEIERGESAFRTLISVHVGLNSLSLLHVRNEEQKQPLPGADGDGGEARLLRPDRARRRLRRRRDADDAPSADGDGTYVLNGQKNWISYATVADYALVFAKTDPSARPQGASRRSSSSGSGTASRRARIPTSSAIWAGSTGELFFSNVQVPAENLVGEEGDGFKIAMYSLDQGRLHGRRRRGGRHPGLPEASVKYANERQTFGAADRQAPVRAGHDRRHGARLRDVAAARDAGRAGSRTRACATRARRQLAKWHATESAFKAAHNGDPGARRVRLLGRVPRSSATSATRARRSSTRARRRSTR